MLTQAVNGIYSGEFTSKKTLAMLIERWAGLKHCLAPLIFYPCQLAMLIERWAGLKRFSDVDFVNFAVLAMLVER